jgi:hypothetical protein
MITPHQASEKRPLASTGVLDSFLALGVSRFGHAFPSRHLVHALERDGDDDVHPNPNELSDELYERVAFHEPVIELRATPDAFAWDDGFSEAGGVGPPVSMCEHVTACYKAPNGKDHFTVRDLCRVLSNFTPAFSSEHLSEGGVEALAGCGHYDYLDRLTLVPGTTHTYEVKWVCEPCFDGENIRAWQAAADKNRREQRAAAEVANPGLRGVGAFFKDNGCQNGCGFFAVPGTSLCSTCARPSPTTSAAHEPGSSSTALPGSSSSAAATSASARSCPTCGQDLSGLGPLRAERHITRCGK